MSHPARKRPEPPLATYNDGKDMPTNRDPVPREKRRLKDLLGEHRIEMINEAKELSRAGLTEAEMAAHFGVSVVTLRLWKGRDPSFQSACQHFSDVATGRVVATLYDRAVGYYYEAEEVRVIKDQIVRVPVRKFVEPNIAAIIFWLKNRDPEQWRDIREHKVDAPGLVEASDPRKIAMAVLTLLREARQQPQDVPAIEDKRA